MKINLHGGNMILVEDSFKYIEDPIPILHISCGDWEQLMFDIEKYLKDISKDNKSGTILNMVYIKKAIIEFEMTFKHKDYYSAIMNDIEGTANNLLNNSDSDYGYLCKQENVKHILTLIKKAYGVYNRDK